MIIRTTFVLCFSSIICVESIIYLFIYLFIYFFSIYFFYFFLFTFVLFNPILSDSDTHLSLPPYVPYVHLIFRTYTAGINARVRISGISKVELSLEELELVLQTLVYDGRLEEVSDVIHILRNIL